MALYDKKDIKYDIYFISQVDVDVDLKPSLLNNHLYNNLNNQVIKYNGICYKNYGFIQEVQRIISFSDGRLINESNDSSIRYKLSLQCKLCYPCIGDLYYASINLILPTYIKLVNGPMQIIVTPDNNMLQNKKLQIGQYVVIRVLNVQFCHMEHYIIIKGEILDLVDNDEDIKNMYEKIL